MIGPFLFKFGNAGFAAWTNVITDEESLNKFGPIAGGGVVKMSSTKVPCGFYTRGAEVSVGVFKSLNSLDKLTYAPEQLSDGTAVNNFVMTNIAKGVTLMSSKCMVEYNQLLYWLDIKGNLKVYNGTVYQIPNTTNRQFFIDTLEFSQKEKIFAAVNADFGEIAFFYPKKRDDGVTQTECNHAIVVKISESNEPEYFYDCSYDDCWRSSVTTPDTFPYPIMSDAQKSDEGTYWLWIHEFGANKNTLAAQFIIESYISTPYFMLGKMGQEDVQMRSRRVEIDAVQSGSMSLYLDTKGFPRSEEKRSGPFSFSPEERKIDLAIQGRLTRYTFQSNEIDGDYQLGDIQVNISNGDVRPNS